MSKEIYFCIARVHPAVNGTYAWTSLTLEFLDQSGYERWIDLRTKDESNSNKLEIQESLDVFIKKDLAVDGEKDAVLDLSHNMTSNIYKSLRNKLDEARLKYETSDKTQDDWDQWQEDKATARLDVDKEFTSLLNSEFEKLDFNSNEEIQQ